MTDQSILDRPERDITIEAFVGHNSGYYTDIFDKIQRDENACLADKSVRTDCAVAMGIMARYLAGILALTCGRCGRSSLSNAGGEIFAFAGRSTTKS